MVHGRDTHIHRIKHKDGPLFRLGLCLLSRQIQLFFLFFSLPFCGLLLGGCFSDEKNRVVNVTFRLYSIVFRVIGVRFLFFSLKYALRFLYPFMLLCVHVLVAKLMHI
jgi:hypothetical protein